jgi:preprotein translocase subunit SecE
VRSQGAPRGPIASIADYFGEVISELRKAVWPTREETRRLTVLVIIVATTMGAILGSFDFGFTRLVNVFLG